MGYISNSNPVTFRDVAWVNGSRAPLTAQPGEVYVDGNGLVWLLSIRQDLVPALSLLRAVGINQLYQNFVLLPPKLGSNQALNLIQQYVIPPLTGAGVSLAAAGTHGIVSVLTRASGAQQALTRMVNSILDNYFREPDRDWCYYNMGTHEVSINGTLHVNMR